MPLAIRSVQLRSGDRSKLEQIIRSRTSPQRVVERAKIILASAGGMSGNQICAHVGVSRPMVTRWLDRYAADGLTALLGDRPRSGRPPTVTPEVEAEIIRKTLHEKPASATHWSTRLMAREVGLHSSTVSRIWRSHGLKPHRRHARGEPPDGGAAGSHCGG